MPTTRRRLLRASLALLLVFGFCFLLPAGCAFIYDPWPAKEALDAAHPLAAEQGYEVLWGGMAEFVREPDEWGGCEVESTLNSPTPENPNLHVVVRVSRTWRYGKWRLVSLRVHDPATQN